MNIILTPVYHAFDRVKEMCAAIDMYSTMPYVHILIDDNSKEIPPLNVSASRRWILLRDTVHKEKNNMGVGLQTGFDYIKQNFWNEKPNPEVTNLFIIESDVVVGPDWDKLQLQAASLLSNWATLDVISTYEGARTYPTAAQKPSENVGEDLEIIGFPEFQCTLFSRQFMEIMPKFTDFASHFDIMFGRWIEQNTDLKCYRHKRIEVVHHPHSSRKVLVPEAFK